MSKEPEYLETIFCPACQSSIRIYANLYSEATVASTPTNITYPLAPAAFQESQIEHKEKAS